MNAVPMWMKNLDDEDMIFIKRFLLASGSLKEVAKLYGVTYPTVKYSLQGTTQGRYLTGGVPLVRFSM